MQICTFFLLQTLPSKPRDALTRTLSLLYFQEATTCSIPLWWSTRTVFQKLILFIFQTGVGEEIIFKK